MKMSDHGSSSSSSDSDSNLEDSTKKPPTHSRRSLSVATSVDNLSTVTGYIAALEKDQSRILKKLKIITNHS